MLLHHGIHRTHISLCILEILHHSMVALAVFLANHLSVRFLNFLPPGSRISLMIVMEKRRVERGSQQGG